ncbi:MAG: hypothetical protein QM754_01680 [Tepidisphaeraceae bacterium]
MSREEALASIHATHRLNYTKEKGRKGATTSGLQKNIVDKNLAGESNESTRSSLLNTLVTKIFRAAFE